jgi:hypothetical protein
VIAWEQRCRKRIGAAIGQGQANTSKITTYYSSATYAAHVCNNLVLGGYDKGGFNFNSL